MSTTTITFEEMAVAVVAIACEKYEAGELDIDKWRAIVAGTLDEIQEGASGVSVTIEHDADEP